jgi:hypothetical protein
MARFRGSVGYATDQETAPGVWREVITEKSYFGDVLVNARRLVPASPETLNDNLAVENSISIVADAYAVENFSAMRYVNWNGSNWTITSVKVLRPRLILTIGDLWNGDTPGAPSGS